MLQNFNWNVIQLNVTQLEKYDYNHERKKKLAECAVGVNKRERGYERNEEEGVLL